MAEYNLDMSEVQDSILAHFQTLYPNYVVRAWALPDDENIEYWPGTSSMKPHLFIWFSKLRRTSKRRSRSLVSYKLDSHETGFDVLVVSQDAETSNYVANQIANDIIGFKPARGGGIHKGQSISEAPMQVKASGPVPIRWVSTDRYRFVPFAQKIAP